MTNKISKETYRARVNEDLQMKVRRAQLVMSKALYQKGKDGLYISTSGADSSVLVWIAEQFNINLPRVHVPCDSPEVAKHNYERGDSILKCEYSKQEIIRKYGYPLISKSNAMKLSRWLHTKDMKQREIREKGYLGSNGKWIYNGKIPNYLMFLRYAPFELSEKCCDKFKKSPLKLYEKETGRCAITGELAEESNDRLKVYLKHGCNQLNTSRHKVCPMATFTQQDVLRLIKDNNIKIPSSYGEVVERDGELIFTGEQRTGCDICGFGVLKDKERFIRLKNRKSRTYNYMMNGGEWVRKPLYRWVKFRPNSLKIWSNIYWVPNDKGFGYRLPLKYIEEGLKCTNK